MRSLRIKLCFSAIVLFCLMASSVSAEVTRVEILSRSDLLAGRAFGQTGAYEKIIARVYFAVDPANVRNQSIVDLDKAPRNGRNQVEFSADLYIIKPKDMNRGNGAVLLEIPNRGGKGMVRFFNRGRGSADPSTESEIGDGFLMVRGFTLAWVGWQFDTPESKNALRLYAPVATDAGKVITGLVRSDFVFSSKVYSAPLGHRGQNAQPVLDPQSRENVLTVRDTVLGARRVIAPSEWQFAKLENDKAMPDPTSIYLKNGFEPGKIYEVVYRTQNPTVVGLGLAGVRDLISYFKYRPDAIAPVRRAYGFGISQSGRFLRHFLYQGFNADERDRQVFDAVNPHVAGGGRGSFNHRFAEVSRDASPFSTFFYPTDIFPFTDVEQRDPETGETDGLLTHSKNPKVLPKIFYTFSSYEYWGRAASLIHTTIDGLSDAPMMDNVRIYYFVGGQHGTGPFPPAKSTAQGVPQTVQMTSPNDYTWSMRALLVAMDRWVKDGTRPPQSQYPRIADGTLVQPQGVRFPKLPGIEVPRTIHEAYRVDYGPQFKQGIISLEPPRIGKPFVVMVPQVDRDGIDLGGIRMPEVAVPLATYTGWNYRDASTGASGELVDFAGSYIPFARTRAERERTLDPRLSIEERYPSREHYTGLIFDATLKLVKDGYLLYEDRTAMLNRAIAFWVYATR